MCDRSMIYGWCTWYHISIYSQEVQLKSSELVYSQKYGVCNALIIISGDNSGAS